MPTAPGVQHHVCERAECGRHAGWGFPAKADAALVLFAHRADGERYLTTRIPLNENVCLDRCVDEAARANRASFTPSSIPPWRALFCRPRRTSGIGHSPPRIPTARGCLKLITIKFIPVDACKFASHDRSRYGSSPGVQCGEGQGCGFPDDLEKRAKRPSLGERLANPRPGRRRAHLEDSPDHGSIPPLPRLSLFSLVEGNHRASPARVPPAAVLRRLGFGRERGA